MGDTSLAEEEDAFLSNIYVALAHPTRQGILRLLGQNKTSSFSNLMEKLNVKDSSTLTHHLKKLEGLVDQGEDGKYVLTDIGHLAYNILRRGDLIAKVHSSDIEKELRERSLRNPLIAFPLILVACTIMLYVPWPIEHILGLTYIPWPIWDILAFIWQIGYFVAGCYLIYWGLKHILPEFGFSKRLAFYITFTLFGLIWIFLIR
jgi:DNA-binding transcriptional ArsR family regulator